MESCSVLVSKCENAPRGTALLYVELVVPAALAPVLDVDAEAPDVSAFCGGVSVFADGVYRAEVVSALEPADVEPFPVELAAAPRRDVVPLPPRGDLRSAR